MLQIEVAQIPEPTGNALQRDATPETKGVAIRAAFAAASSSRHATEAASTQRGRHAAAAPGRGAAARGRRMAPGVAA